MTEQNTVDAPLEAPGARTPTEDKSIRPFRAKVSDEALADLRRRIQATRWADKETVAVDDAHVRRVVCCPQGEEVRIGRRNG